MMKLEGLEAFVAITETGSISQASKRLRVSTSVVSERLARLEQGLGVALVHRTTRRLTLTEDGATLLPRARAILDQVADAASELAERRGGLAGPLRLSAPLSFGMLHLAPALFAFLAEHPRIELTLELDDRFVDVAGGGYDAVVRIGQVADNRLVSHRLAESRRVLVASPAYLARHGRPTSLDELGAHRAVNYTYRGAGDWRFIVEGRTAIVRATSGLHVNNGDVMRAAVEAGLGIALLPTFLVAEGLSTGSLVRLDVGAEPDTDVVQVVYAKTRGVPTKVRALVDFLSRRFGNPPYWDTARPSELPAAAAHLTQHSHD